MLDRAGKIEQLAGRYQTRRGRPLLSYIVGEGWVLAAPWTVQAGLVSLTVPSGFCFDLASIPRVFWPLIGPMDCSVEAPLAHDYLYRFHEAGGRVWKRRRVDGLFMQLMRREGVCAWRRRAAWLAVRAFGWWAWRASPRKAGLPRR